MAETYFKKSFKGYDTEQVDEFIVSLSDKYQQNEKDFAEQIRALEAENARLRDEIEKINDTLNETAREHEAELAEQKKEQDLLCAEIGEKMVIADQRAADIVRNAEKEANLILSEARRTGENEAKAIRTKAEEEAAKLIDETRKKCDSLSAAAEEFRIRQNEMNRSMTETEKRFGDALDKLRAGIGGQE